VSVANKIQHVRITPRLRPGQQDDLSRLRIALCAVFAAPPELSGPA